MLGAVTVLILNFTGFIDIFGADGALGVFKVQSDQTYMAEIDKQLIDVFNKDVEVGSVMAFNSLKDADKDESVWSKGMSCAGTDKI